MALDLPSADIELTIAVVNFIAGDRSTLKSGSNSERLGYRSGLIGIRNAEILPERIVVLIELFIGKL